MNDWLTRKEEYLPRAGGLRFLDRSLLSILSVLSRIRRPEKTVGGQVYRLNPTLKLVTVFIVILTLSLSRSASFVYLADSCILLAAALLDAGDLLNTLLLSTTIALFGLLILLPSMFTGNGGNSLLLLAKIAGSALAVNFLAHSTKWRHMTRAIKFFRVPDLFILVLELAVKYIVILGEFSIHMLQALRARSVGRNTHAHRELSNLAGILYFKSREMAEQTYSAMECRGFTGEYPSPKVRTFSASDLVYLGANLALAAAFVYFSLGKNG
jgi:cobalt/nickel transport system permease protein